MHIRRTGEERQTPGEKTAHKATDVSPIPSLPSPWRKFSPFPIEASGGAESPRTTNGPHAVQGRGGGLGAVVRGSWPGREYAAFEPRELKRALVCTSMSHLEIIRL